MFCARIGRAGGTDRALRGPPDGDRTCPAAAASGAHLDAASIHVEVEAAGAWWPGVQHDWRMYIDGTGWRAAVRFVASGPAGISSHDVDVPVAQIRERAGISSAR
jgi:hypothetical protein